MAYRVELLETRIVLAAPNPFQLSSILATNGGTGATGFVLNGVAAGDGSGRFVSNAGDINGDGFEDVAIGAYLADPNGIDSGSSYVVFGQAGGFATNVNLSALDGTNGFRLDGVAAGDDAGVSVSSAGDINGDGFGDLLIGAQFADINGSNSGAAYVVFGKASGFSASLNLATLDGSNGFRLNGIAAGDRAGFSVSGAGDVNGDGFDDILLGAIDAKSQGSYTGAVYVVFGKASGFAASMNLSSLDGSNGFRIDGLAFRSFLRNWSGTGGDVNGDGFDDIVLGAGGSAINGYDSGATYVVFGKSSPFSPSLDLSTLDGSNGFRLLGAGVNDISGGPVSVAGDVNGDGFDDLLIGASTFVGHLETFSVVFGKATGFSASLNLATLDGTTGFILTGLNTDSPRLFSASGAGDVNGDGFDDLVMGEFHADPNGSDSGASYVVFGKASGFAANMSLSALDGTNGFRLDGVAAGDQAGAVSRAGDVNGDGFDDLLVGAPGADPNGSSSGATYVVFGANFTNSATPTVTLGVAPASLAEAVAGTSTVTATLSAVSSLDVTVNLSFSGTATNVLDYTRSATQIVITAGHTSGTVTLTAVPDTLDETNETIIVNISDVTNGRESGTQRVTVTISDVNPSVEQVAEVLRRQMVMGATIITHGYQLLASGGDSLLPLAQEIRNQADTGNGLNATAWLLDYDVVETNGQFAGVFDAKQSILPNPGTPATGEVVLLFDWARESSVSSSGWGEAAGDALFNLLVGLGLVSPATGTSVPLHLIGHSFGTAVTSEAVEQGQRAL